MTDTISTQSDALREALERIGVSMMPPEIIEGRLTLRLVRVDIARAALEARGLEIRSKNDE